MTVVRAEVHTNIMRKKLECKYLGDIVSSSGKINETIQSRISKAIGINGQILSILNRVTLGIFYFQTALILREAMLVNGVLMSCES